MLHTCFDLAALDSTSGSVVEIVVVVVHLTVVGLVTSIQILVASAIPGCRYWSTGQSSILGLLVIG